MKDLVLLDVTPHSLGIETEDGTFTPLVERNSTMQSESHMARSNVSVARFELNDIPAQPAGVPQIEVTFEIEVDGPLSIAVQAWATARIQSMLLHPSGGHRQPQIRSNPPQGEAVGLVLHPEPLVPHSSASLSQAEDHQAGRRDPRR